MEYYLNIGTECKTEFFGINTFCVLFLATRVIKMLTLQVIHQRSDLGGVSDSIYYVVADNPMYLSYMIKLRLSEIKASIHKCRVLQNRY